MYENVTINQFKRAMWENSNEFTKEELDKINTEYIDTSGMYDSDEFSKVAYIHYLTNRVNSVSLAIRLQRDFINNFDIPFLNELKFFKKFGYNLYYNKDNKQFELELQRIEKREGKYKDELEEKIAQLLQDRLKKNKNEYVSERQSREQFIRTILTLGKIGYRIDNDKTTMEEVSFMIKQQGEENQKYTK